MEAVRYKVLFADDEYWTREKMKTLIQWEKYNLEFLPPAENGEDVLEKIEAQKPDILITDINMPYINGVELLQRVQEKYSDIVTFVISGYDDFEYVRESFLSGSINYLMKPVNKIDLVNALSKALEIIGQRKRDEMETLKAASLIEDREFSRLLEREELPFTPNITINSSVGFAGTMMILIKIHDMSDLSAQYKYDMNLLSYTLKQEIKKKMNLEKAFVFNHIYRANEFIIVTDKDVEEMSAGAYHFLNELTRLTNSPVTMVMSTHSYSMESIRKAYIQTVSTLMVRPFSKKSIILNSMDASVTQVRNRLGDTERIEIQNLLKYGKGEEVKKVIFEKVGLKHCEQQGWDYLETKQTVKRIIGLLQEYAAERKELAQVLVHLDNSMEMLDKSLELLDISYACEFLEDVIDNMLTAEQEEKAGDSVQQIVWQAVDYIQKHYFEPLTLSTLAEKFNVESTYFSRMFRKETGENIMQYIAKMRIENAKEYMRRGNMNLTEIAFVVGYDDYTYFNKVFRKVEGISPREYRSRLAENAQQA